MRSMKDDPNIDPRDLKREKLFVGISSLILFLYFLGWTIAYSLLDALIIMGLGFIVLTPALITNGMMVLVGKIKGIKSYPIDCGKNFFDGKRILGDGKTWNGFIGGWITGFLISSLFIWWFYNRIGEAADFGNLEFATSEYIRNFFGPILDTDNHVNYPKYFLSILIISLGSPIGDAIGSFFKRRTSLKRGEVFLFWDQNDFVIVSSAFACIFFPFNWYYWIFLLLITPLFTFFSNWISYLGHKKEVPW